MPKISTKYIHISEVKGVDANFSLVIWYNQDDQFWSEIPPGFDEAFDTMSDAVLKQYHAKRKFKYNNNSDSNHPHKKVIWAEKEADIEGLMKKFIERLLLISIVRTPVIIIDYDNENDKEPNRWFGYPDLGQVGLTIRAWYCYEINVGDHKKYYKYKKEKGITSDEVNEIRTEIQVTSHDKYVIIPDTKENRIFIEGLHSALKILSDKIDKLTETKEKFLEAIGKNQKLLS